MVSAIYKGMILHERYRVEALLGEGSFGVVTKCCIIETGELVAIKINKAHPEITRQARKEIAVWEKLQSLDPDTCNIVSYRDFFFHEESICLEFELLDQSLMSYFEDQQRQPFTTDKIRPIIHQLVTTLYHVGSMGIIHADLKPENIMVVDRRAPQPKLKVIDFGLACLVTEDERGAIVQTTMYRAPEVMLQLPLTEAVDMWSLGITVAELAIGEVLYPSAYQYDVLRYIVETQGLPPDHMLEAAQGARHYFTREGNIWRLKTPKEIKYETGQCAEEHRTVFLKCLDDLGDLMESEDDRQEQRFLVDLIKRMLHLDPEKRITPSEILHHPFMAPSSCSAPPEEDSSEEDLKNLPEESKNSLDEKPKVTEETLSCSAAPQHTQDFITDTSSTEGRGENMAQTEECVSIPVADELGVEWMGDLSDNPGNESWFRDIFRKLTDNFFWRRLAEQLWPGPAFEHQGLSRQ